MRITSLGISLNYTMQADQQEEKIDFHNDSLTENSMLRIFPINVRIIDFKI